MRKRRRIETEFKDVLQSKDLTLSHVWKKFELHLQVKNRTENTIKTYHHQLSKFYRYVYETQLHESKNLTVDEMEISIDIVNNEHVQEFFVYLSKTKKLKPSSIVGVGKILNVWFQYLTKVYDMEDLTPYIIIPKVNHEVKYTPSDSEIQKHLSYLDMNIFVEFRLYVMYQFVLNTGVRLGELQILLKDIDMENRTILINGKGNKQRKISINDKLFPILETYIRERNNFATCDYLFVTENGKRLVQSSISAQVKKFCNQTNIPINLHSCRRKFITAMLNKNVNPLLLCKIVGHSSPHTILTHYYHTNDNDVKKSMNLLRLSKKQKE